MEPSSLRQHAQRWARWGLLGLGLGLGLGSGCTTPSNIFVCGGGESCGVGGFCEATGYCSFPDESCPSGHRYGAHASPELANTCVDALPDPTGSTTATGGGTVAGSSTSLLDTGPVLDTTAESSTGPVTDDTSTGGSSTTGEPGTSTGEPIPRVTDGLLALYTFTEGGGTTVADVSGVGSPLDLTLEGMGHAWSPDGLSFMGAIARSTVPATKILDGCQADDELTVEAWVTPLATEMEGPARLVTMSESTALRNFTVGHGIVNLPSQVYVGRVRTSDDTGTNNGGRDTTTDPIATTQLTHVTYVRSNAGYDRVYVDGQAEVEAVRTGDFSNWDPTFELAVGNELTLERPWQGTMHLVAIYGRALTDAEIQQNIDAGF